MSIEHAKQLADNNANSRLTGDMELLLAISQDFVGAPEMSQTLANAVQQIMSYMDTEASSIFLLDAAGETLTCLACAGPVSIKGLTIARNQGIVGRALAENAVQMVRDVSADGDFSTAVDDRTGFTTRSILCAPLMVKGRMLGALEVINKRKGDGLFDPADKRFLQVLAGMVSLAVHNAQMTEALVEQERMRRELDLAREIQRNLLPDQPADDFPIHGLNLSALEVSGDFYDFFTLADGRIAWGLGDVSGKGMNSAMLMAKTISLFRCLGKTVHDSAQLLAILNDELAETASRGMFVTMAAGVYNPANGEILFANAGHQPPLYRSRSGTYRELEESSPPLGILPGMTYTDQRLKLDGGRLYLFTDGVTEGWSADGRMLEVFGLKALLDKYSLRPPAEQLERVVETLVHPGVRLRDDLTLLVIG
ncbi:GAF domain-containing SpoIIE family protein phosphatase [Propionivibrio sp.]|uniref:PP2C family protein-serine/threonine phosphatase n=1 Tax=Propionivibrio sp. TaxID=2212460 RepID=UPI0025D5BC84|nr:GAF domain-containing SpoIIE family protein phosphatase [Propionivibrio sp.]MBK8745371.1 SpoIIE family protein phosphatase [Propionivibrio sp.]MBK8894143.1 SpoIIE family protein phosphatase [Propionivibrio sp.]